MLYSFEQISSGLKKRERRGERERTCEVFIPLRCLFHECFLVLMHASSFVNTATGKEIAPWGEKGGLWSPFPPWMLQLSRLALETRLFALQLVCSGTSFLQSSYPGPSYKCSDCWDCHFENCIMIVMHLWFSYLKLLWRSLYQVSLIICFCKTYSSKRFLSIRYFSSCLGFLWDVR